MSIFLHIYVLQDEDGAGGDLQFANPVSRLSADLMIINVGIVGTCDQCTTSIERSWVAQCKALGPNLIKIT